MDNSIILIKKDLQLAIEKICYDFLKFIARMGAAVAIISLYEMLAKGFHWL